MSHILFLFIALYHCAFRMLICVPFLFCSKMFAPVGDAAAHSRDDGSISSKSDVDDQPVVTREDLDAAIQGESKVGRSTNDRVLSVPNCEVFQFSFSWRLVSSE